MNPVRSQSIGTTAVLPTTEWTSNGAKKVLVLYVPVLHAGYIKLFEQYKDSAETLYVLGASFIDEASRFHKEIRALEPQTAMMLIESLRIFDNVRVLEKDRVHELKGKEILTADEDVCRKFIAGYLPDERVEYAPVFLRWDEKNVKSDVKVAYDRVSEDAFDREMIARAADEAEKSSDWWRHVGAVVVKDRKVIFENHNHHVPSDHTPYVNGDPRDAVEPGTLNLIYTSLHAEQAIVADAAKKGASLGGASMYLNIFPCPLCAKLMAYAGIKKCFFRSGSAWLDAESILKANGVEIVLVK